MPSKKSQLLENGPIIVWFRNDLRLADNAALLAASQSGNPIICIYIFDDTADETTRYGGAQLWWLHHSLHSLRESLAKIGGKLILRRGIPEQIIKDLITETDAKTVLWNRRYATQHIERDSKLKSDLKEDGLTVVSYDGALLHEPTKVKTGSGGPYRVYTPFWRAFSGAHEPRDPAPAPQSIMPYNGALKTDTLSDWALLPTDPDWSGGIKTEWTPGEKGAAKRLDDFLEHPITDYKVGRDFPSQHKTSKLSPHLAFGEISPYQIWAQTNAVRPINTPDKETFRKEVVWREFAYHLLVNYQDLKNKNYNPKLQQFSLEKLEKWQKGQTGYPIVDAGMRQLWQTGWMHNRVRMIVGSFLVKHLLIDWREGEKWFWDTLVDADPASNTASWQWIAGCGADAAPYFRVFNPIIQGEKFDTDGDYVKLFCPELKNMPNKYLHKPWEAPADVLDKAGIVLGKTYPNPIVDHKTARDRALAAYQAMKDTSI
ncbi:Deoxyribodipyrimidine photo-lyase [Nymphon striatum]|nr:Deoxyribodipyrimidine photo-lyase [Nymphon striatum]